MPRVMNKPPVDYSKCNQTVTIYHRNGSAYAKTIVNNAFFDFKKVQNVDKTGSREANSFLLVIPQIEQPVFVGDKVLLGQGADITTAAEWAELIPAKVSGLVVVGYVDPKFWRGVVAHWEAGG